jgi:hypothetical protein
MNLNYIASWNSPFEKGLEWNTTVLLEPHTHGGFAAGGTCFGGSACNGVAFSD